MRPDGPRDEVALPQAAAEIIGDVFLALPRNDAAVLLANDTEISLEDTAAILDISRPLVRRRMDGGMLPFRIVGAYPRVRLSDVNDLKRKGQPVRDALDDLRDDTCSLMARGL